VLRRAYTFPAEIKYKGVNTNPLPIGNANLSLRAQTGGLLLGCGKLPWQTTLRATEMPYRTKGMSERA